MNNGIEGDVQSRMDAFRGNPQALAQRYAQNQQLIDLLALQKLKSEKDAAARQMQMQAGQGQMPTIAQQREQELMGMAKQEVAQRVGAVGQQQAQQQQKNLQQAMQGGIAQAPAPNMMPPQAMASGGIVAFAGGGETAFTRGVKSAFSISPPSEEEAARRKRREDLAEIESQFESGPMQGALTLPAEEYDRRTAVRDYIRKNRSELINNPQMFSAFKANPDTFISGGMRTAAGQITPASAQAAPAQAAPSPAFAQQDQSYASKEARGMPAPAQAAPAQAAPTSDFDRYGQSLAPRPDDAFGRYDQSTAPRPQPEAPVGAFQGDPQQIEAQLAAIKDPTERAAATAAYARQRAAGGAPAQGIAQAAQQPAQQSSDLQGILSRGLGEDIQASPEARAAVERAAYDKQFGPLYKQQQELSQQGIAQLQQRMAQQPKKDPLTEFLRGMSSQRTLGMALGAGGAGMSAAQREAFEQQAALEDQLQKLRETGLGAQVTQETARYGAGKEAAKTAAEARKAAMQVAGPYLSQSGVAEVRTQLNDAALQLRQQGLNQQLIAAATTAANHTLDNLQRRLKVVQEEKAKPAVATNATELAKVNAEESRIQMEMQNVLPSMLRLFGVPVDTKNFAAPSPTAGHAIPPPPVGAVRQKGAK